MPTGVASLHHHVFRCLGLRVDDEAALQEGAGVREQGQRKRSSGAKELILYKTHLKCSRGVRLHVSGLGKLHTSRLLVSANALNMRLVLEHSLAADDWLGRADRLAGSGNLQVEAQYFNTSLGALEHVLEPWSADCTMTNTRDSPVTFVRLEAAKHLNVNLSPSLTQALHSMLWPTSIDAPRFRASLLVQRGPSTTMRRMTLVNRLGVSIRVSGPPGQCHLVGPLASSDQALQQDEHTWVEEAQLPPSLELGHGEKGLVWLRVKEDEGQGSSAAELPSLDIQPLGWEVVTDVYMGLSGCQAYPLRLLTQASVDGQRVGVRWKKRRSRTALSLQTQLSDCMLLVVEASEADPATRGSGSELSEEGAGAQLPSLEVELRTNIKLINLTSSAVRATFASSEGHDEQLVPQACASAVLSPEEVTPLPLSIVTRQPAISVDRQVPWQEDGPGGQDDTSLFEARRLVQLHPALFDPFTLEALRRMRALEERSISLQHRILGHLEPEAPPMRRSSSTPEMGLASTVEPSRAAEGTRGGVPEPVPMVDWSLCVLPPYQLVNGLPCALEVRVLQPKVGPAGDASSGGGEAEAGTSGPDGARPRFDPAVDIFSLPFGLMPAVQPEPVQKAPADVSSRLARLGSRGLSASFAEDDAFGDEAEQPEAEPDPSEPMVVVWEGVLQSGRHQNLEGVRLDCVLHLQAKLVAGNGPWSPVLCIPAWAHLDRLSFNGAPLPLFTAGASREDDYADVCVFRRWTLRGTRRLTFFSEYWVMNRTGLALVYRPVIKPGSDLSSRDDRVIPAVRRPSARARRRVEWASARTSDSGARVRTLTDRAHLERFGRTAQLPVMFSCPAKTLRAMPYALQADALEDCLRLTQVQVRGTTLHFVNPAVREGCRAYSDSRVTLAQLPSPLAELSKASNLLAIVTSSRWEATHSAWPLEQDAYQFCVSQHAYVYVCARLPSSESAMAVPSWLSTAGFRRLDEEGGVRLTISDGARFEVFRKFYSSESTVRLEGPPEAPLLRQGSAFDSISSADSSGGEGGADRGGGGVSSRALRRSTTLVPMLVLVSQASVEEASHEVDVQELEVERDVKDRLYCNERYAMLPSLKAGDKLYVDRSDMRLTSLPLIQGGGKVLGIQTAHGDRGCKTGFALRFRVMQPSRVMVCYDGRARCPPNWLSLLGFQPCGLTIPGPENEFEYVAYELDVQGGTEVTLGGNSARGSRGPKAMYFVLVVASGVASEPRAVAEDQCDAAGADQGLGDTLVAGRGTTDEDARLSIMPPHFDAGGRYWSAPFNVDAINTTGTALIPSCSM
jgi:hypothetical protein